jgi:hypothetical protein
MGVKKFTPSFLFFITMGSTPVRVSKYKTHTECGLERSVPLMFAQSKPLLEFLFGLKNLGEGFNSQGGVSGKIIQT